MSLQYVFGVLLVLASRMTNGDNIADCPTISSGYYPFCECRHGPKFDEPTNTCPNPECPPDDSIGIYPDCTCTQKNFDYSIYLNECFRVCPDNSTGYWPKCECDLVTEVFDKIHFLCRSCPLDSFGTYPNCSCDEGGMYNSYLNFCDRCENDSFGTYPDCKCQNDTTYDYYDRRCKPSLAEEVPIYGCVDGTGVQKGNSENDNENDGYHDSMFNNSFNCIQCPYGSVGVHPNCSCEGNGTYSEKDKYCIECPFTSIGKYPDCICKDHGTYIIDWNSCFTCPEDSIGQYPQCTCTHPFQYEKDKNECVGCPKNTSGISPNCRCNDGYYSEVHNVCIECPENSTGSYPNCECEDDGYLFSAFINECYIGCPDGIGGKHPHCKCNNEQIYNVDKFICESNIGKECPPVSIGVGPECLCIEKKFTFNLLYWKCVYIGSLIGAGVPSGCPDSGKWPQCESSIDRNALLSLVG